MLSPPLRLLPVLSALMIGCLLATAPDAAAEPAHRPRIGLVLSGGGARGAAHIGVLEVLQQLRVPVDCISATSMGALVGGTYAAGIPPAEMRADLAEVDWRDLFIDSPDYTELSYRTKDLAHRYMPGVELGISGEGVRTRLGVREGQKVKLLFNRLVRANQGERYIEKLPLPLSIIATDIISGERVELREGSLTAAMRASMAVPGLLAPLDYEGRKLVDGGLVENLPIGAARQLCQPDVVIAVNSGTYGKEATEIEAVWKVLARAVNILMDQNVAQSLALLQPQDIYIEPDLAGYTNVDFASYSEIADLGRSAAEKATERLRALAVSEAEYAAWWEGIRYKAAPPKQVDAIEIAGLSYVNPQAVLKHIEQPQGAPLDSEKLDRDIMRVFGDGYYQSVDYAVLSEQGRTVVQVRPVEKKWGRNYLQFGVNLNSNLENATYNLRTAYHRTWINSLGAELQAGAQIGSEPGGYAQFYQPADARQHFFLQPEVSYFNRYIPVFANDERIAEYGLDDYHTALIAGANLGYLGQAWIGWAARRQEAKLTTGTSALPEESRRFEEWRMGIHLDRLNELFFPTAGWSAQVEYADPTGLDYSKVKADLRAAYSLGDYVVHGRLRYVDSPSGTLPVYDADALGGPMNLSGFAPNQIIGDRLRYANLRVEKIIGKLPLGLHGDLRLGMGLEAGRVDNRYTELARSGWLDSAALYLGGETPLGAAFLGYGYSSEGSQMVYLFIGTP